MLPSLNGMVFYAALYSIIVNGENRMEGLVCWSKLWGKWQPKYTEIWGSWQVPSWTWNTLKPPKTGVVSRWHWLSGCLAVWPLYQARISQHASHRRACHECVPHGRAFYRHASYRHVSHKYYLSHGRGFYEGVWSWVWNFNFPNLSLGVLSLASISYAVGARKWLHFLNLEWAICCRSSWACPWLAQDTQGRDEEKRC
jgi:hypothetical protein